ncbi:Uncharacterized membrane protein [Rhizobium miluonense]|uniref:Uncharacterized membrane protein n=1 Tax=Rhizobium miluonense TaxID=411945 RepID=A0A1C3VV22_9HYPH|nr:Uncharacterized membrane protein [Rhizobium miluonense]
MGWRRKKTQQRITGSQLEAVSSQVAPRFVKRSGPLARIAFLILAAAAPLFFLPNAAHADFRTCNGTQNLVGVAIGYRAKEGWVTEGWWQIPANTCATLIEGPLQSRYYYLYAEDAARGGRWTGDVEMCVAENEFKIPGVKDCYARGYQKMGFKEYDTGRQASWMVQLSDTPGSQESQN